MLAVVEHKESGRERERAYWIIQSEEDGAPAPCAKTTTGCCCLAVLNGGDADDAVPSSMRRRLGAMEDWKEA
jgi:hypothetical protein